MIRGISRQVIEVKETGSAYYERAFLVLRPEYASAERALLEREARRLLRKMDAPAGMKRLAGRWKWTARAGAAAALLSGAAAAFAWLH